LGCRDDLVARAVAEALDATGAFPGGVVAGTGPDDVPEAADSGPTACVYPAEWDEWDDADSPAGVDLVHTGRFVVLISYLAQDPARRVAESFRLQQLCQVAVDGRSLAGVTFPATKCRWSLFGTWSAIVPGFAGHDRGDYRPGLPEEY
jgi:hypothetical protein